MADLMWSVDGQRRRARTYAHIHSSQARPPTSSMFASVIQSADSSLRALRRCACFARYSPRYASRTCCIAARYLLQE